LPFGVHVGPRAGFPPGSGAGLMDAYAAIHAVAGVPANHGNRPADPTARSLYPAVYRQPLSWLNPLADGILWNLLGWTTLNWNNLAWDNLAWDSAKLD
jgi:hypothetical protein